MDQTKKKTTTDKSSGAEGGNRTKRWIVTGLCLLVMLWGIWQFTLMASRYDGDDPVWVRIPHGASEAQVGDSLRKSLGDAYGNKIAGYWSGNVKTSRGAYLVEPGQKAIDIARMIDNGRQTPIKLTFNNVRSLDQLSERLTARMDWDQGEFVKAFENRAEALGILPQVLLGRMMPDTYEVYWTSDPDRVIDKILKNYDSFWTEERVKKAAESGLTPDGVAIIASIAEEETNKADERGKVARLYLNRLHKGMKLQADPTVKFAVGDWSITRVGGDMLNVDSPYNTYKYSGLPPAPIRVPSRATLQAVLDAPAHDYLYMCAKSDFSGYHDFTSDYSTHLRNAAAFRAALDARGITLAKQQNPSE